MDESDEDLETHLVDRTNSSMQELVDQSIDLDSDSAQRILAMANSPGPAVSGYHGARDEQRQRHTLPRLDFEKLARGAGDAETVSRLRRSELSWRKMALRLVLVPAHRQQINAGPLTPIEEAVDVLDSAHRAAPAAVDVVWRHPPVGIWTLQMLRQLSDAAQDRPTWSDLGYFHLLAAAAGIRAGIDFHLKVPVDRSRVVLPTLGYCAFPEDSGLDFAEVYRTDRQAHVRYDGRSVMIARPGADPDDAAWHPVPEIEARSGRSPLHVALDSIDPYRELQHPKQPRRLSSREVDRWRSVLRQAWDLLVRTCPESAAAIAAGLSTIVPAVSKERFRPLSASASEAFGAAVISEPDDATQLAVTLVHEFQHNKLGALLHLVDLFEAPVPGLFYAPWRDDPRPLAGVLQGAYAFAGICDFWAAHQANVVGVEAAVAQFELALWRQQATSTVRDLSTRPELTRSGRRVVDGLAGAMESLNAVEVRKEIQRLADLAADDHRAQWRAYHVQPSIALVDELVAAWRSGQRRPRNVPTDGETLSDNTAGRWLDARAVLMRRWLQDEAALEKLLEEPDVIGHSGSGGTSGATVADGLLVCGRLDAAQQAYLAQLDRAPGDVSAWTGLRLLLAMRGTAEPNDILQHRPELVCAVHRALARPDEPVPAVRLLEWFNATD
jgi:HEXXH motif-containing protein